MTTNKFEFLTYRLFSEELPDPKPPEDIIILAKTRRGIFVEIVYIDGCPQIVNNPFDYELSLNYWCYIPRSVYE